MPEKSLQALEKRPEKRAQSEKTGLPTVTPFTGPVFSAKRQVPGEQDSGNKRVFNTRPLPLLPDTTHCKPVHRFQGTFRQSRPEPHERGNT